MYIQISQPKNKVYKLSYLIYSKLHFKNNKQTPETDNHQKYIVEKNQKAEKNKDKWWDCSIWC